MVVTDTAVAAELSAPAATSWSSTRFDLIVRGADGLIYHKYWNNGTGPVGGWTDWGSIGAPPVGAASSPTVTTPGPDVLQVFVRGGDNRIWNDQWTHGQGSAPGGWSGWGPIPNTGNATWAPTATDGADTQPDVFYTGTDGAVYYTRYDSQLGWVTPVSLGGVVQGSPAATTTTGGRLQLAVRGSDSQVYLKFADTPASWTNWGIVANASTSMSPAMTTGDDGQANLFFRGLNNSTMYHEYYNASLGWVGPGAIPNTTLVSSPGAARLNVFLRSSSGDVMQHYYEPSLGWHGPGSLGQPNSDGKMFRESSDPAVYYFNGGIRYWVTSPAVASAFGLDLASVQVLPDGSLSSIPRGMDITLDNSPGSVSTTVGPEESATSSDLAANPDGGDATAATVSKCRSITNKFGYNVAGIEAGMTTFSARFCRNPSAHTTWSSPSMLSMDDYTNVGFQIAGYSIEQLPDKIIYNVTHGAYSKGGVHMEMKWKVKHCIPLGSLIGACTRSKTYHSVSYGYYDGSTARNDYVDS